MHSCRKTFSAHSKNGNKTDIRRPLNHSKPKSPSVNKTAIASGTSYAKAIEIFRSILVKIEHFIGEPDRSAARLKWECCLFVVSFRVVNLCESLSALVRFGLFILFYPLCWEKGSLRGLWRWWVYSSWAWRVDSYDADVNRRFECGVA